MTKPEWGTKRQCPKCGTRFYDLCNDDPIVCINCQKKFKPEVILKSKMTPLELLPEEKADDTEEDILDEKALLEDNSDNDIEADDNTVVLSDDDGTNVADGIVKTTPKNPDE